MVGDLGRAVWKRGVARGGRSKAEGRGKSDEERSLSRHSATGTDEDEPFKNPEDPPASPLCALFSRSHLLNERSPRSFSGFSLPNLPSYS